MGEVVDLRPQAQPNLVWVCVCGSTTHYHHEDGSVSCGACRLPASSLTGEWRERLPDQPAEPKQVDATNFKVTCIDSAEVFLRRLLKAGATEATAIIVLDADGDLTTWGLPVETEAQRAWMQRKLAEAHQRLTGSAPAPTADPARRPGA